MPILMSIYKWHGPWEIMKVPEPSTPNVIVKWGWFLSIGYHVSELGVSARLRVIP